MSQRFSEWAHFITDARLKGSPQMLVFHRLTGDSIRYGGDLKETASAELRRARLVVSLRKRELDGFRSWYPSRHPKAFHWRSARGAVFLGKDDTGEFCELALSDGEARFLEACDGSLTLGRLQETFHLSDARLEALLRKLTDPRFQLLGIVRRKNEPFRAFFPVAESFAPLGAKELRRRDVHAGKVTDLRAYHRSRIRDAFEQFDKRETTVSHAFRAPSEALGGLSYGEAFFEAVRALVPAEGFADVLEVGGGTGVFSREFLKNAPRDCRYSILDLSPALQASQRKQHGSRRNIRFLLGDAEKLALPKPVSLLISNEVIADLRAVVLRKDGISAHDEAAELIQRYRIDVSDAPDTFAFNVGAIRFLERIEENLQPGGLAVLTEYGSLTEYPVPTSHLDHDEHSIQYRHLLQVAQRLGFLVELRDLASFLSFNLREEMLDGGVERINHLLRRQGCPLLPTGAYTRRGLESALAPHASLRIGGLAFSPLGAGRHWGPGLAQFKALILRKRPKP